MSLWKTLLSTKYITIYHSRPWLCKTSRNLTFQATWLFPVVFISVRLLLFPYMPCSFQLWIFFWLFSPHHFLANIPFIIGSPIQMPPNPGEFSSLPAVWALSPLWLSLAMFCLVYFPYCHLHARSPRWKVPWDQEWYLLYLCMPSDLSFLSYTSHT